MKTASAIVFTFIFFCGILFTGSAQTQNFAQERNTQTGKRISQNDVIKYYEQLLGSMTQQLKFVQDQNATLEAKASALEKEAANSKAQVENLKQEVAALRDALEQESKARDTQIKKIIQSIEKLAQIPAAVPPAVSNKKTPALAPLEFEEYVVQKGATLSAISQAYGVTVQDIKKANNLKGDNIRVGQKLLIPVK